MTTYYEKNKERISEYGKEYRKNNPEKFREYRRLANKKLRDKGYFREYMKNRRKRLLDIFGGTKCAKCSFSDWRALQIDHINSDGFKENKRGSNSSSINLKRLLENKDKFQILCANCNWIKVHEDNEKRRQQNIKSYEKWGHKDSPFPIKSHVRKSLKIK